MMLVHESEQSPNAQVGRISAASDAAVRFADEARGADLRALAVALAVPAALWLILFAVLPPSQQDFPLNDDWAYARGAFAFHRGEGIHYYLWATCPLLGQWLWAMPFTAALGESHAALRLSTIVLALLGGAAFFDLLRHEAKLPARQAAFATTALLVCPLYFVLSNTFMTDIPSLAFSLIALALFARAFRQGRVGVLMAASGVALLGVINRQSAVAAPLAAAVFVFWRYPRLRWRPLWLLAVWGPVAAGFAAHYWFVARADTYTMPPIVRAENYIALLWAVPIHFGLAALPLLLLVPSVSRRSLLLAGGFLAAAVGVWAVFHGYYLGTPLWDNVPYTGNVITPWGALPLPVLGGRAPVVTILPVLIPVALVGSAAGTLLLARLIDGWRRLAITDLLPLFALAYVPLLLIGGYAFDRYFLPLMPGAIWAVAVVAAPKRPRWTPALAALGAVAFITLGLTHDLLAQHSARWNLGRRAVSKGVPAKDIDAGFEWNCSHTVETWGDPIEKKRLAQRATRSGEAALFGAPYGISTIPLPETVCVDTEPYWTWLPPWRRELLLVEKGHEGGGPLRN